MGFVYDDRWERRGGFREVGVGRDGRECVFFRFLGVGFGEFRVGFFVDFYSFIGYGLKVGVFTEGVKFLFLRIGREF